MSRTSATHRAVYAALIGNALVAITKAIAGAWTGSASMQSEAVHSFVDTGNELLLLYGMRRAARRADPDHPLGHGRELYFWSFVVALLVFALGAGVSTYQGIAHLRHPEPIEDPLVNYIVLGLSFLFEGASWIVSWRQFRAANGPRDVYTAFRRSKDPPSFMVLFEDSAALVGIAIALFATFMATYAGVPQADGIGSILIGLVLAVTASLLARESKSLLVGEQAERGLNQEIIRLAAAEPDIERVNGVITAQLAPEQILVALSIEFPDALTTSEVERQVGNLERKLRATHPSIFAVFVKPQSKAMFEEIVRDRYGTKDV